ncbi:YqcC family protein [Enterobacteriaceae bacterium LUAb1]
MSNKTLLSLLQAVEAVLRETANWQEEAPEAEALNSDQPFCLNTLKPVEWLQWVMLPRMYALLESGAPLPAGFAVAPYYDIALPPDFAGRLRLMLHLNALDDFFAAQTAC